MQHLKNQSPSPGGISLALRESGLAPALRPLGGGLSFTMQCRHKKDRLTEAAPALLAAVKAMLPWLGKLIADGGHLRAVVPDDALRTMDVAQALVDRIEAPDPVFEPLIAQADYMDQQRAARRAKK